MGPCLYIQCKNTFHFKSDYMNKGIIRDIFTIQYLHWKSVRQLLKDRKVLTLVNLTPVVFFILFLGQFRFRSDYVGSSGHRVQSCRILLSTYENNEKIQINHDKAILKTQTCIDVYIDRVRLKYHL